MPIDVGSIEELFEYQQQLNIAVFFMASAEQWIC
jgi:hypothetical protein